MVQKTPLLTPYSFITVKALMSKAPQLPVLTFLSASLSWECKKNISWFHPMPRKASPLQYVALHFITMFIHHLQAQRLAIFISPGKNIHIHLTAITLHSEKPINTAQLYLNCGSSLYLDKMIAMLLVVSASLGLKYTV